MSQSERKLKSKFENQGEMILGAIDEIKINPDFQTLIKSGVGRVWLKKAIEQQEQQEEKTPTQKVHDEQVRGANTAGDAE